MTTKRKTRRALTVGFRASNRKRAATAANAPGRRRALRAPGGLLPLLRPDQGVLLATGCFFLLKCRRTKTGDYKKKSASDPNLCWRIVPPPFFAPEAKNPFPPSCLTDGWKKLNSSMGWGWGRCTPPSGLNHPDGCTYPMVPPASELDPRRGVVKRRPGLGVRRAPGRGAPHPEPGWDAAVPHLRADPECQLVPQARAGLV